MRRIAWFKTIYPEVRSLVVAEVIKVTAEIYRVDASESLPLNYEITFSLFIDLFNWSMFMH